MTRLPDHFIENMKILLKDEFQEYLASFEDERVYGLRINTSKISVEDFMRINPFHLKKVPWSSNGFYYDPSDKPAKHPYYYAGLYYLQEPSAMLPAEVLPIEEGDLVLDVCAAPGGKSTELAAKLHGTGVLLSNDISHSRAQALLKNLELFGTTAMMVCSEDPLKMKDRFQNVFDKILIDAPCSGEGMFRKEPAVIKSYVEHGNEFFVKLQKSILSSCAGMLKPGGLMVYSTCTFSPKEDEEMIAYLKTIDPFFEVVDTGLTKSIEGFREGMPEMSESKDQELSKCIRLFPHKIEGEGHFVTLLRKKNFEDDSSDSETEISNPISMESKVENHLISNENNFKHHERRICRLQDSPVFRKLPDEAKEFMSNVRKPFFDGEFVLKENKLYFVPNFPASFQGIWIMRGGLYIGECKQKRFEPSQAMAMALKEEEFSNTVSLPSHDPRVIKYLKGETIDLSDQDGISEGLILFETDHFPLGFGKVSHGIMKNKYFAGWRYQ